MGNNTSAPRPPTAVRRAAAQQQQQPPKAQPTPPVPQPTIQPQAPLIQSTPPVQVQAPTIPTPNAPPAMPAIMEKTTSPPAAPAIMEKTTSLPAIVEKNNPSLPVMPVVDRFPTMSSSLYPSRLAPPQPIMSIPRIPATQSIVQSNVQSDRAKSYTSMEPGHSRRGWQRASGHPLVIPISSTSNRQIGSLAPVQVIKSAPKKITLKQAPQAQPRPSLNLGFRRGISKPDQSNLF